MDPRIVNFLRTRGKLTPVGVGCVVVPGGPGRFIVQAPRSTEGGVFKDGEYVGNAPFTVNRDPHGRDIVTVQPREEEPRPIPGLVYWEIIAPSTALFTQDPLPVDIDPADLPMGILFSTTFEVQFVDWGDQPPFFPVDNPLYQLATVQPYYVIERWRDAVYAEDVGTGTIVPVLDANVTVNWSDTLTIPPDAVDPTGTYPNDSFKIRLYTDATRAVEMLVINSA